MSSSPCLCSKSVTCPRISPTSLGTSYFSDKSVAFARNPRTFVEQNADEKRVFVCRLLMRPCFVLGCNSLVKTFLNQSSEKTYNGMKDYFFGLFGHSILFSSELEEVRDLRNILVPLFDPQTLLQGSYKTTLEGLADDWMDMDLAGPEPIVIYDKFKAFSSKLVMKLFLDLDGPEAEDMMALATQHWHGIISVPLNIKVSFLMSSSYRKAVEAKEKLLQIIEDRIKGNQSMFLRQFMEKTDLETVKNHVLVFVCALIPKALSSIFAFLVETSKMWRDQLFWKRRHDFRPGLGGHIHGGLKTVPTVHWWTQSRN